MSDVPLRRQTRAQKTRGTPDHPVPGYSGPLHFRRTNGAVSERGSRTRAIVPWHSLLAAALLSLALGAALYEGLAGGRSTVAPAARLRASSHLRPGASPHKKGLSSLPLAAQGPISQALGAESPAYRVSASRGGFAAASPAQRLRLRFDRSGVSLSSGASTWG